MKDAHTAENINQIVRERDAVREVLSVVDPVPVGRKFNKTDLMKMGSQLAARLDKLGEPDEYDGLPLLIDSLREEAMTGDLYAIARYQDMSLPDAQVMALCVAAWERWGFPQLVTSHRYAAALMASKISGDVLHELKPPWPAFLVDIPSGLLSFIGKDGKEVEARFGLVRYGHFHMKAGDTAKLWGWSYCLVSDDDMIWGFNRGTELLYNDGAKEPDGSNDWMEDTVFAQRLTKQDDRCMRLFWRLTFGLCLAAKDKSNIKETKSSSSGNKRKSKEPVCRTYIIGKPPSFDFRPTIRAYITGKRQGGVPTVQVLVCGHWKHQAHGPHSSLRKLIWLEPYWRGPEDAPILTRVKKVEDVNAED